ncbi:tetratricopeptide repeat protein [Sphingomonas colocasiae]|uniref:Sel1 repeat family protein n=1 Tax=Sphingomonas colocasiae TaxID=1848973 RepID=A0ABS7PUM2_9SPHN|nr:tetratricopeptide repeat protein [Sphingomonas colocasiae]MBY8824961.1 sel1 repeat family protein [Sphingomonas colocasiae]
MGINSHAGRARRFWLGIALASSAAAHGAAAQPASASPAVSPSDSFREICVRSGAQMDAVIAAARAAGFAPAQANPAAPPGFTKAVALERGKDAARLVVVVSTGKSAISKAIPTEIPARACAVTAPSGAWDARAFAREWVGIPPQLDVEGLVAYSYFERAQGNAAAADNDLPALIAGANAGELRTLVVREAGELRALSWVVVEAPSPPLSIPATSMPLPSTPPPSTPAAQSPAALASRHETDPFAPCRWEASGKGRNARSSFFCPDETGKFRVTSARGVTEQTPALAGGGDVAAMLKLAAFYADGPQPARDSVGAFAWSRRAAEAGAPGGAFNTGLAYDGGNGVAADRAEAQRWYRAAVDRDYPPAMINLAAMLLAGANGDDAVNRQAAALVRRAADAGSPDGLFNMGHLSETGLGVPKDMAEAQRWYRLAADRKDSRAMLRLGQIHADGIGGVARDDAEGARWMAQGVKPMLGIGMAMNEIYAGIYRLDDAGRRAEFARAAEKDPGLALKLGMHLAYAKNPARNPGEALRFLRIAADAGSPIAALVIGVMHAEGDGVPRNDVEAIKWLRADNRLRSTGSFQRISRFADSPAP